MLTSLLFLAGTGLAGTSTDPTQTPEYDMVSPGFLGFVTVFLLAVATVILVRSMVKHLRKVRYSPDPNDTVENARRENRG